MIHLRTENKALCGWSGFYTSTATKKDVTCKRCLIKMGKLVERKPDLFADVPVSLRMARGDNLGQLSGLV